jgi:hypothetical protein
LQILGWRPLHVAILLRLYEGISVLPMSGLCARPGVRPSLAELSQF